MEDDKPAIQQLDELYPIRYNDGLIGLGQFILNIVLNPAADREYDAESIANAVLHVVTREP